MIQKSRFARLKDQGTIKDFYSPVFLKYLFESYQGVDSNENNMKETLVQNQAKLPKIWSLRA